MTAFYICAILLAPMLFMGMIPSAHAEDVQEPMNDSSVTGPGAYTYPPYPHATPPSFEVCDKPSDWEECHKDENIICGNFFDQEDNAMNGQPSASRKHWQTEQVHDK